jgi:hypothetical protein
MSEETEVIETVETPKAPKATKAKAKESALPEGAVMLQSGTMYVPS